MKKRNLDITLLDEVVVRLRQGKQLDKKYRDHNLSGNFAGFRECHIKPDWLQVYLIENDILTLTLVDTGSHSTFSENDHIIIGTVNLEFSIDFLEFTIVYRSLLLF